MHKCNLHAQGAPHNSWQTSHPTPIYGNCVNACLSAYPCPNVPSHVRNERIQLQDPSCQSGEEKCKREKTLDGAANYLLRPQKSQKLFVQLEV